MAVVATFGAMIGGGACASSLSPRDCWIDSKTSIATPLVPRESAADPANVDHRVRPEMRGGDGTVFPAADFIRAPNGRWLDAVTGRSVEGFPDGSSPDPANPDHRLLYKDDDDAEPVIAEYSRVTCATPGIAPEPVSASTDDAVRLDGEILAEINAARTDPAGYAARFKGSTNPEVLEAVQFLQRQSRLSPLKLQVALLTAASRHAADQGRAGTRSHVGTDGSTLRDRVIAAGVKPSEVAEEIALDADTGMGVARQLIVDYGVPDHAHRASLFNASLAYAGVACNPHSTYRLICVIDVSGPIGR